MMIARWLPKNKLQRLALVGLLVWALFGIVAAVLGTEGDAHFRWRQREGQAVTRAVLQHGATSPEAAAAVAQMGAKAGSGSVVALIDPQTGTAVAAYPAELAGKKPEEMTVGGVRLPQLSYLLQQGKERDRDFGEGHRIIVQASPVGWSGQAFDDHGRRGGRTFEGRRGDRRWGRAPGLAPGQAPAGPAAAAAPTEPILVVASPVRSLTATEVGARAAGGVAALGFVLYWISVAWWVFQDAKARRRKAYAWGVLTLLTNLVGVVIYLLARRCSHDCPACGSQLEKGFAFCPACGHTLKEACPQCGKELKPGWQYCAACGAPREGDGAGQPEA